MVEPDIIRLSPNFNRYPMPIGTRTVIIHATRSGTPLNPSEFDGTLNYMSRPGTVSSHWVIARDGRKARVVYDEKQAWHAGEDNDNAWGIELEQGVEEDGFTEEQLASLVAVCRSYIEDYGVPIRHASNSIDGGFVGHQETEQGRRNGKSDPGFLFHWDEFIAALTPPVATPAGIGVHYTDGGDAEIWRDYDHQGRTLDGVGMRFSDGSVRTIWP